MKAAAAAEERAVDNMDEGTTAAAAASQRHGTALAALTAAQEEAEAAATSAGGARQVGACTETGVPNDPGPETRLFNLFPLSISSVCPGNCALWLKFLLQSKM